MAKIESGVEFDREGHYEKMTKCMDNMDTIQYPLRIPRYLYKKVKIKLAQDETKFRDVLLEMIKDYVKE